MAESMYERMQSEANSRDLWSAISQLENKIDTLSKQIERQDEQIAAINSRLDARDSDDNLTESVALYKDAPVH